MEKKKGIPKEVLDELGIEQKISQKDPEVKIIVEKHQAKIVIPASILLEMELKEGQKCTVSYDHAKKELKYKLL